MVVVSPIVAVGVGRTITVTSAVEVLTVDAQFELNGDVTVILYEYVPGVDTVTEGEATLVPGEKLEVPGPAVWDQE